MTGIISSSLSSISFVEIEALNFEIGGKKWTNTIRIKRLPNVTNIYANEM